jgi:hypothetical protein
VFALVITGIYKRQSSPGHGRTLVPRILQKFGNLRGFRKMMAVLLGVKREAQATSYSAPESSRWILWAAPTAFADPEGQFVEPPGTLRGCRNLLVPFSWSILCGKARTRPIQGRLRIRAAQRLICTLSKPDRCCSIALAKGGWHRASVTLFLPGSGTR